MRLFLRHFSHYQKCYWIQLKSNLDWKDGLKYKFEISLRFPIRCVNMTSNAYIIFIRVPFHFAKFNRLKQIQQVHFLSSLLTL